MSWKENEKCREDNSGGNRHENDCPARGIYSNGGTRGACRLSWTFRFVAHGKVDSWKNAETKEIEDKDYD